MTDAGATSSDERIEALDFVRGCALFGILLMNIVGMGLPHAYNDPTVWGGAEGADLWAWMIVQVGLEGTQRGLFSMLFGAGVIIFTSRLEAAGRTDTADLYMRRNLWLIGFGLVNAWALLWYGDILYTYGIVALFLFAFRKLPGKTLLTIGIAVLLANAAWNAHDTIGTLAKHDAWVAATAAKAAGAKPTAEQVEAIEAWQEAVEEAKPPRAALEKQVAAMRGGYWSAYGPIAELNFEVQSWWLYRYFADVFGMMILGMGMFRLGVLTLERRTGTYLAMMLGGYAVGLATNIVETGWMMTNGFSALAASQAGISYDLGRLGMTIGHLGLLLLFCRSGLFVGFRRAMASVGRMALTNYLTHSLVALLLFVGLGWFGQLQRHELYYIVFATWAVQLVLSPWWLARFRFGPVEWLWRSLTYGRPATFRGAAIPALA